MINTLGDLKQWLDTAISNRGEDSQIWGVVPMFGFGHPVALQGIIPSDDGNDNIFEMELRIEPKMPEPRYDPATQIAIIWSLEDVRECRPDLTDEQCMEVLQQCEQKHDCDQGICWDTIRTWCDELFPE